MSRYSAAGPSSNTSKDAPKTDPGKLLGSQQGDFKRTGAAVTGKTGGDPGKAAPAANVEGFRRTGSTQPSASKTTGREFQGVGAQGSEQAKLKPISDE